MLLPIRVAIRFEIKRELENIKVLTENINKTVDPQNLLISLNKIASISTSHYIIDNLYKSKKFYQKFDLLSYAVDCAQLQDSEAILEFGVFEGESINYLASLTSNKVYGFDSFQGLPEDWRSGFEKGCFKLVGKPPIRENVIIVEGWFEESIPRFLKYFSEEIKLLHVDCDLYSSTKTIFMLLEKKIKPGCIIVFDEYFNYPGWEKGEFKAFQEFIRSSNLNYSYLAYNAHHEQVVVKIC